ncbi:hypothetical protein [Balneatrix alpica]|uniref:Uncharacterized protein n=2 Tax=Balneatrix alpica TaxID=75684 RepID=A0ABV5ZAP1_9GAMM|nr:hypothetical protein [Balneatrix alpica]
MLKIVEPVLLLVGLAVLLGSLIMYGRRSGDWRSILVFWRPTIAFSAREFFINRVGLTLMALGVVVRFINHLFI